MTKQDKEFVQSPGHLDLSDGPPKTTRASFANKPHSTGSHGAEPVPDDSSDCNEESSEDHGQKKNSKTNREKRMSSYELGEIVVAKKIKSCTKLLAFAREQKLEGKTDVAEFVLNRGSKTLRNFCKLHGTWRIPKKRHKGKKSPSYSCFMMLYIRNASLIVMGSG